MEEVWNCDLCGRGIVEALGYDLPEGGVLAEGAEPVWRRQFWPELTPRVLGNDVPALVRELYAEASRAENARAFRLAGVGYRAVVEEICKDQRATKYKLVDKIKELAAKGVPTDIIEVLDEGRVVGNESIHQNIEFSAAEIEDVALLIAEVCLTLYVQPAERQRMAASRVAHHDQARSGAVGADTSRCHRGAAGAVDAGPGPAGRRRRAAGRRHAADPSLIFKGSTVTAAGATVQYLSAVGHRDVSGLGHLVSLGWSRGMSLGTRQRGVRVGRW
ncbi:DUF4145 domain-containing protein [Streptomyces sp. NPDC048473]|uniref:DUF4145 domain-containing protein n=1 Tax=unclassified Streptomyces TaxID=2593676 RepID=UPI0037104C45